MILVPRHNRGGIFLGRGGGQLTSRGAIRQALSECLINARSLPGAGS
jgi:hypothetical protein